MCDRQRLAAAAERGSGRELSNISESSAPVLIVEADGVRHDLLVITDALHHAESSGTSQTEVLVSGASESSEAFHGFQFTHQL